MGISMAEAIKSDRLAEVKSVEYGLKLHEGLMQALLSVTKVTKVTKVGGFQSVPIAGLAINLVQVYRTQLLLYFVFLRFETGFELSSSCLILPGYASSTNRSSLIFMR
jgi:hypothetical protein